MGSVWRGCWISLRMVLFEVATGEEPEVMRGVLRCWRRVFSASLFWLLVAACGVTSQALAERAYLGDLTGTGAEVPFAWPRGLAVDEANDLWVLDESPESQVLGRARIDKFDSSLTFLDQGSGRQPKTKELKEVEEAENEGKLVCKSKSKSSEWLAKYWKGEYLRSIAFSTASGHLYLDDGGEGQLWMLGQEGCALQDILAPWSRGPFERSESSFFSQATVDNSAGPFKGDIYAFSETSLGGHPTSIYRVEPKANSEGHSVAVPFGCGAPYVKEGIIRGAPTGVGGAVIEWIYPTNTSPGQLVIDPATGNLYAAVGGGIDEFEPSGCFVRRFTAANGNIGEIEGMAFDPVTGDLVVSGSYRAGSRHAVVDEFSLTGRLLEEMTEADGVLNGYVQNVSTQSNDLAVDSSGDLFVAVGPSHLVDEFGHYEVPPKHPLEVEEPGSGSGSVTSEPSGIDCPSACKTEFTKAEGTVKLTETPSAGSTFGGWVVESGSDVVSGCTSVSVECEVMMNGPVKVKAKFDSNLALVEVKETGSGSGTVMSKPSGISCPSTCKAEFTKGETVELKEKENAGSGFKGWKVEGEAVVTAGCAGPEETCKFEANGLVKVEVIFESEASPVLTVEEQGSGSGSVTSAPSGIDCPSTCSAPFTKGKSVKLTEAAGSSSTLVRWEVEEADVVAGCTDTEATCTVAMNGPVSVKVVFDSKLAPVEVEEPGSGSGMVTSEPPGVDCPSTCEAEFTKGKPVELKEKAGAGSSFKGWKVEGEAVVTAGCTGTEETCKFEVNGPVKVKAIFESDLALVEVEEPGFGSGTVTSQPAGIECPGVLTCSWEFPEGKSVELKEKASAGSIFNSWKVEGGAVVIAGCTGTEATCTVMVNGTVKVEAMFAPIFDDLSVSVSGDGSVGSHEGAKSGPISGCTASGGVCAAELQEGADTTVTLTERPGEHQRFVGWSGACTGTKICIVTVDAVTSVEAVFEPIVDPLSVHTSGAGAGTVTSSPIGVDCGSTCSASFEEGTTVTLAATPESGSTFTGWSGCGAEPEGKCEVTLTAAASVTATFALVPPKPLEVVGQAALIPVPPPSVPVVPPSNKFAARATVKGATASLELVLPGPGTVSVSGTGLKSARANPAAAGPLTLKLILTTTGVRALNKHKRLTVHVTIVFQPTDGIAGTVTVVLALNTSKTKKHH